MLSQSKTFRMICKKLCVKVQPAIDGIYPFTRHHRCWTQKTANTLNLLCQEPQFKSKQTIHVTWHAETKFNTESLWVLH